MQFSMIKAYNVLGFINDKCRFMTDSVSEVEFKSNEKSLITPMPLSVHVATFHFNWAAFDYWITLQKPTVVSKPEKGRMPYYLIPYTVMEDPHPIVTNKIDRINSVEDFISIFYPAPTNISIKIIKDKKSTDFKNIGDRYEEFMNAYIKSVEFCKTCIKIYI